MAKWVKYKFGNIISSITLLGGCHYVFSIQLWICLRIRIARIDPWNYPPALPMLLWRR